MSLMDKLDDIIADLNDAIYEIKESENLRNNKTLSDLPQYHHAKESFQQFTMPPPYKKSSQLSNKSIQKYTGPKDKKLSTVSSLSDAFGGWLQKANYNIFNKRSTKKKYFILANLMIYIFKNDLSDTEYEDSLPITKESLITKKLDQNFTLDFLTKFLVENVLIIMGEGRRVEMVEKSRRLELTCSDAIELNCWLDCFNEAIKEAQDGREPLVFNDLTSTISNDTQ